MQDRPHRNRRRHDRLALPLALLILAIALVHYATVERARAQLSPVADSPLRPALIVVPAEDGQSILIQAGGVGQLGGQVFANLSVGPTGNKGSYTMTYSDTVASYVTSVPGFAPTVIAESGLSITTTQGLDSGVLVFTRALMAQVGDMLTTNDGGLTVALINPGSFSAPTYLAAAPSYAPPGPPPAGRRLAGRAYSLRASGALAVADQPLALRLTYDAVTLTEAEIAALAIYAWDPVAGRWDVVPGALFPSGSYVSAPITRFTFYALMTTAPHAVYLPALAR